SGAGHGGVRPPTCRRAGRRARSRHPSASRADGRREASPRPGAAAGAVGRPDGSRSERSCGELPVVPDRDYRIRQRWNLSEFDVALARSVEVRTARGQQAELDRDFRILRVLVHGMAAAHHLDADAARLAELADHGVKLHRTEPVAARMGEHGLPARLADPRHRLAHGGPALGHEARPPLDEETGKHLGHVPADALLDEEAGEVGARDERRIPDVAQRPLVGPRDAGGRELLPDLDGPGVPAAAGPGKTLLQGCVPRIDIEADHVDRLPAPGDGDLHAGHEAQAELPGARRGLLESAEIVVVREGEHLDALGDGTLDDGRRRQRTVGHQRMAVQVGIDPARIVPTLGGTGCHGPKDTPYPAALQDGRARSAGAGRSLPPDRGRAQSVSPPGAAIVAAAPGPEETLPMPETQVDEYDRLYREFGWLVPTRFNISVVCATRWARDPDRI